MRKKINSNKTLYKDFKGREWTKETLDSLFKNWYKLAEARDALAYYFFKR